MDVLELARWQFGITTVYHFLMVPLTIGLSVLVAGMQTVWLRTSAPRHYQMTKFWGKLLLVNFAMGVVTGIVMPRLRRLGHPGAQYGTPPSRCSSCRCASTLDMGTYRS